MRMGGRGVLRGVVADKQPLWQNALTATLLRLGFGAVAACDSPEELRELVVRLRPHLVLVDPDPFADAVDDLDIAPIVVVSGCADAADGHAFVSKCATAREIERALREIVSTHLQSSPLTKRELEILGLVAGGLSNRQVAQTLWLSDQTVKFHLAQTYRKLGVRDRRAAVERVQQLGLLLEPPAPAAEAVSAEAP
jgi:DNA-binding NarL/FixJ family response regulator